MPVGRHGQRIQGCRASGKSGLSGSHIVGPTTEQARSAGRTWGALLLADISGYTGFLQGVGDAHQALIIDSPEPPPAYGLMSSLLETIMAAIIPPFRLVKLEGDAVFAVGEELPLRGTAVVACLEACYAAFGARLAEANSLWTCSCDACARIHTLDLKFVLHYGEFIAQRVGGQEEVLGPEVNVAHRLLKNHALDLTGGRPYALLSDAAVAMLGVPAAGMLASTEKYEHLPPINVHVLPLG